ncbi:hypothetical protein OP10G_3662 [Fimbriimonas ginsengisoli Gsoil 348]|uniref:Uncharacterized protein n=2 Tax=Fimbriimonas ginsengisoli TaxID=1005039 RepID=A0A068NW93_FIMGI|nr:hypothetical protein OP10G_3662 [Fimbriimonas ginsengisoli Gsoil 348]
MGSSTGSTAGTSTGGTGGGGWNDFYFDDYLGLWVQTESTDTSFTQHLYADEAKTEPAGLFQTNFPSGWNVFPYQFSSSFAITRGNFTGARGMYVTTVTSDVKGSSSYENVWPGYGSDKGTSSWNGSSSAWSSEANDTTGAWWKGGGQYFDDGHGSSSYEDSLGFKASFVYNADGSGSARMEGPVTGLPATITWTASGHTRIVYADGTVEEWDAGGFFGGGGEGGTTGAGTDGGNTGGGSTGGTGNVTTGGAPNKVK